MYARISETHAQQDPLFRDSIDELGRDHLVSLRCPECLGALHREEKKFVCAACRRQYPIIGGLPWLAAGDQYYHADVPEPAMRQLVEDTLQSDWYTAFRNLLAGLPQTKREVIAHNLLDSARAFGLSVLPIEKNARVLDIGCGWGTLSLLLAESVEAVVALDLSPLRARFTQLRAHEDNLRNVAVIGGGDTRYLPLESNSFDIVILNGVLEWTAVSRAGKPRDVYREYLDEVHRVLRPGGYVYIGIENRLSHLYLWGIAEDHVELPYITLLPRWLADRYAEWRRGAPYRTHTYTLYGYRRLLQASGFNGLQIFYPHPHYRLPAKVIPLDDQNGLLRALTMSQMPRAKRFLATAVIRLHLFQFIPHSYLIVAQKSES